MSSLTYRHIAALRHVAEVGESTTKRAAAALDSGRSAAGVLLRTLERDGYVDARLGDGGELIYTPSRRGVQLLAGLAAQQGAAALPTRELTSSGGHPNR